MANPVTYFKGEILMDLWIRAFVLITFHITKPQYTVSSTKFQGKTFQDYSTI